MTRLRVGLIGVGRIADLHYRGYQSNPRAELYALCDVDEALARRRAAEWGVRRWHTDYRELLADPGVEAVEVITPHHLHAPLTIAALEAGKHVSVQKPMALDAAECDAMIAAARRSGRSLRVFENFRYYPAHARAKALLDAGAIGEPLSIRMKAIQGSPGQGWAIPAGTLAWRFDERQSGGGRVVFDYGYHLFALALFYLGDVERVFAWITHRPVQHGWTLDSPAMIVWKYRDAEKYGCWEAVTSDELLVQSRYWPEDEWVEITGSRGFLWVNRCTSMLLDRPVLVMYRDGVTTEYSDLDTDWGTSFVLGSHDWVAAVLEGRQAPLSGEEGKRVLELARAAQRSARERREVVLEPIGG